MVTVDTLASLQQLRSTFASLTAGIAPGADPTTSSTDFDSLIAALPSSTTTAVSTASASSSAVSSSGSLVSNGSVTGADVVADAEKYLGVPYVLGGESTSGIDCSGLVQKTFADLGVSVTRLVHTQKLEGQEVDGLANAKPGDLIVFKGGGHIGIYAGNDMVIHAPYPGRTVSLQKLWVGDSGIETIRRIVPSTDSSSDSDSTTVPASTGSTASTEPTLAQAQAALAQAQQAVMQADLSMMSDSSDGSTTPDSSSTSLSSLSNSLSNLDSGTMTQGAS
jgi:cell wall-associated NlpC family hydrolase